MNAIAHALAHGPANAMRADSDDAKRREGKGPHLTTHHLTTPHHIFALAQFRSGVAQSKSKVAVGRAPGCAHLDLGLTP